MSFVSKNFTLAPTSFRRHIRVSSIVSQTKPLRFYQDLLRRDPCRSDCYVQATDRFLGTPTKLSLKVPLFPDVLRTNHQPNTWNSFSANHCKSGTPAHATQTLPNRHPLPVASVSKAAVRPATWCTYLSWTILWDNHWVVVWTVLLSTAFLGASVSVVSSLVHHLSFNVPVMQRSLGPGLSRR